ncbi:hypothetical protein PR048_004638 [Dryococelus australis]|uniref:Uncharacterized protein n=1 Tax=Dryococelus australis TaxID=614101 RepID=A0ABQ9I601_9NEOP|nr:hypothetical protein PR048_004638 [Dryococelus australis]
MPELCDACVARSQADVGEDPLRAPSTPPPPHPREMVSGGGIRLLANYKSLRIVALNAPFPWRARNLWCSPGFGIAHGIVNPRAGIGTGGLSESVLGTDDFWTCARVLGCKQRRSGFSQRNVYKVCMLCLSRRVPLPTLEPEVTSRRKICDCEHQCSEECGWQAGLLYWMPKTFQSCLLAAAVAERLARSPPNNANRVQSPAGSPDICMWESCRTMPLVGRFSRGYPVFLALSFRRCSIFTSVTLVGSRDHYVKSRPNFLIHSVRE